MDPFLENPQLWPGQHARLIAVIAEQLQPVLKSRGYYIDIGERVWLTESERHVAPDLAVVRTRPPQTASVTAVLEADEPLVLHAVEVEIRETFLEVYDAQGHRLITSIEIVSRTKKSTATGRDLYLKKQRELAEAGINLVEIDLLRDGPHVLAVPLSLVDAVRPWDYLVSVWRPPGKDYEVYAIDMKSRLPRIRVPLRSGDADVTLDLQAAFERSCDTGPYPERVDYRAEPVPPLSQTARKWAEGVLKKELA
jgi:hypothetical protein